jgi:NAD(P)H-quinone oxidoreductase subunit J
MPEDTAQTTLTAPEPGPVSRWLSSQGFEHELLEPDHLGVEVLGVEAPVDVW